MSLSAVALRGLPEVRAGDDLAALLAGAGAPFRDGDVLVVAHKVVSKAEGCVRDLADVEPGPRARELAARLERDPRHVQAVLDEAVEVLREERALICRTRHGFVCANAGVDVSNVDEGVAAILPADPDRSARRIRDGLRVRAGVEVAVVVSDTFGRPWRKGLVDVAIGCAGIAAVADLRGTTDTRGRALHATEVAIADEVAAAAELVMGKDLDVPVAVVRGIDRSWLRESSVRTEVVRPHGEDLFR